MEDQATYGVDVKNIKRRGGRWDPGKITDDNFRIKRLLREIELQIMLHLDKGLSENQAIYFGIEQGRINWRKKHANKSGG